MNSVVRFVLLFSFTLFSATRAAQAEDVGRSDPSNPPQEAGAASKPAVTTRPAGVEGKPASVTLIPWTVKEQERLLSKRLNGGMGHTFNQFANMFLVSSRMQLNCGVGLVTPAKEVAQSVLQPSFPSGYKPTLREFLDALALQTFSEWKYESSGKYIKSDVKTNAPRKDLVFFEFTPTKRDKPYQVTLPEGWKTIDKGNWVMNVPPVFPVGLDIYEMGTYSCDDHTPPKDFLNQVRMDLALDWAQRVNEQAKAEDLKPTKVGAQEALFYEAMIPSQFNKEIRWRQWVFMVDNKAYFIVSTILPEYEAKIFPDVEKILASFRVKQP